MSDASGSADLSMLGGDASGTLIERMGIEVTLASPERLEGRMPVVGNTQPFGLLHGGANAVLAETLGSIGSALQAGPHRMALGIELSCTHHRAARSGFVHAVATQLAASRSLATYGIEIRDDEGRLVCTARLSCMLKDVEQRG